MDFIKVISQVCRALDQASVSYALIGGFAMALRSVQRAIVELDWERLQSYLEIFDLTARVDDMKV